jgi:hypothetical protein
VLEWLRAVDNWHVGYRSIAENERDPTVNVSYVNRWVRACADADLFNDILVNILYMKLKDM